MEWILTFYKKLLQNKVYFSRQTKIIDLRSKSIDCEASPINNVIFSFYCISRTNGAFCKGFKFSFKIASFNAIKTFVKTVITSH